VTRDDIAAVLDEFKSIGAKAPDTAAALAAFDAAGFGTGSSYGLSKAALNMYTMVVARENPKLKVNACTPGFVETDLTRGFATKYGKTPAEMGMITTEQGTSFWLFALEECARDLRVIGTACHLNAPGAGCGPCPSLCHKVWRVWQDPCGDGDGRSRARYAVLVVDHPDGPGSGWAMRASR
jgi:hypothetical protein